MVRFADLATVPSWFAVLAYCDSARPIGLALRYHATHQVSHPSGRPWLLGRWADGTVTTVAGGGGTAPANGVAATAARLAPTAVALSPGGALYFGEEREGTGESIWLPDCHDR